LKATDLLAKEDTERDGRNALEDNRKAEAIMIDGSLKFEEGKSVGNGHTENAVL
jgi:hypothetical protein